MQTSQAAVQGPDKSVTAYLASLEWDGKPRLDRWLIDCAGAEDSPYVRAVSQGVLLAAVRRARNPGCRFDQMLILEGSQGCGKTSALGILAREAAWFTADLPFHEGACLLRMATEGKWIVEVTGLEGLSRGRTAALKAYLSREYDEARMPYTPESTRAPRAFVIVGTVNTTEYFRDAPGNRRFWPVRVQRFNLEKLRAHRDQLWAEAAVVDMRGEPIALAQHLGSAVDTQGQSIVLTHHLGSAVDRRGASNDLPRHLGSAADTQGPFVDLPHHLGSAADTQGPSVDLPRHLGSAVDTQGPSVDLPRHLGSATPLPSAAETLHKNHLVVTLAADCQNSDVEAVMQAVRMIRSVITVELQGVVRSELQDSRPAELQVEELSDALACDATSGAARKVRLPCPLTEADLLLLKIRTACETLSLTLGGLENWMGQYFRAFPISGTPGLPRQLSKSEYLLLQIRQAPVSFSLDPNEPANVEDGLKIIKGWIDGYFNQADEPRAA